MKNLDVSELPEEKISYLEKLIAVWKREQEHPSTARPERPIQKRTVHPSEFLVHKSHIIGGKLTRAMAYDDNA